MTGAPGEVRLTPAALRDLETIWRFTAAQWSSTRADAYVTGLHQALQVLLAHPRLSRERRELTPPVRVHPYRAHIVIYRIEADHLAVVRIRHRHEDWTGDPIGEPE